MEAVDMLGFLNADYIVDDQDLRQTKSSDTIIILGSGVTINELGDDFWEFCKENDTLALNWWVYHDFIPKYWMFELGDYTSDQAFNVWDKQMKNKDVSGVTWFVSWKTRNFSYDFFEKYIHRYLTNESKVFLYNREMYSDWAIDLPLLFERHKDDLNGCTIPPSLVISPLIYALTLAHNMGYKRIVLAGIELDHSKYFWTDDPRYDGVEKHLNTSCNLPADNIHITERITNIDMIPASQAVKMINTFVLEPNGIQLMTTTKKGMLYPEISYFSVSGENQIPVINSRAYPFKADYFVDDEYVRSKKEKDKLLILGSGTSINDLPNEFFREKNIDQYDTLAINWWIYHEFVPKFWFVEADWRKPRVSKIWNEELRKKGDKYKDVTWFYSRRDQENFAADEIRNVFENVILKHLPENPKIFLYDRVVYSDWPQHLMDVFCANDELGGYFLPRSDSATLIATLLFGIHMGYDEIVLAGVDLDSPFYFWSHYTRAVHTRLGDARFIGMKHSSEIEEYPLSRAIKDIKKQIMDPLFLSLYVASPKSALSKFVPVLKETL